MKNPAKQYTSQCLCQLMFFLLSTTMASAQTKDIRVQVLDSNGAALKPFTLKILRTTNNSIITYRFVSDTNRVSLPIGSPFPDSIKIVIESPAFIPFVQKYKITDSLPLDIIATMQKAHSTLKDVLVTAPPVWTRGDTTFYKVEAFKSGEEKKLKDIIEKLPDFRFDRSGALLYKNKPVEKIMIDGEELFADKVDLLLTSFPVHVLDQIQALENQTNQKLLKGLKNENKVFLNLKLNDNKLKAAFGDITLSAGLPDRYKLAPVIFGLRNKVKFGFISDVNNLGEGFGTRAEQELKTESQSKMESWLINDLNQQTIPEFDSKYYIRNNLWDNRLQVNMPLGKKSAFTQELSYTRDNRTQSTYYQNQFISGTETLLRTDTNIYKGRPDLWVSKSTYRLQPDSSKLLTIQGIITFDRTSNTQNTRYNQPNTKSETFIQALDKRYNQVIVTLNYTHRKKDNLAINYWLMGGNLNFRQRAAAEADNLYQLYGFTDSNLNLQIMVPNLQANMLFGGINYFTKKGKKTYEYKIEAFTTRYQYSNDAYFISNKNNMDTLPFEDLQNAHKHQYSYLKLHTERQYVLNKTRVTLGGKMGIESIKMQNNKPNESAQLKPSIKLNLSSFTQYSRLIYSTISVNYDQSFEAQHKIIQGIVPIGLSRYTAYKNYNALQKKLAFISLSLAVNGKKWLSHNFSISPMVYFTGNAFANQLNGILNYQIDSLSKANMYGVFFNYNANYNELMRKLHIHLFMSYGSTQRQFLITDKISKGAGQSASIGLTINKQWKKKLFGNLSGSYYWSKNKFPTSFGISSNPVAQNLVLKSRLSYNLNETWNFSAYAGWYNNNMGSVNRFQFTMVDAEAQWKPKDKKYYISGIIRNLAEVKSYQYFDLSQFNQSIQSLPILGRNFVISYHRVL